MEGGSFPVSEYLPRGMITMLGFSSLRKQPDSQRAVKVWRLVERLTEEFVDWLANDQNGAFVTPWLEIHLTMDGALRLIAIPESEVEDGTRQEIDLEAVDAALHYYGVPVSAGESSTGVAQVAEMKEEIEAFVSAFEAGKRAYREARRRHEAAVEETFGDYGIRVSRQDQTFGTASGHTEEKAG
jgi:hypothetical protein